MAKSKAVAERPQVKSIATVDAELSKEVALLKDQINAGGGKTIKVKPQGFFESPEGVNLGEEIQLVVIDFINRNAWYSKPYDPDNVTPPDCYALGKNIKEMAPESDSPERQNDTCGPCPLNQFGSASNKKGKACRNFYDLAVLVVDPDRPDAHNSPDAPMYVLQVSPKNRPAWESVVPSVARTLDGPPIKAVITVSAKTAPQGTFALLNFHGDFTVNSNYASHATRRGEASELLFRHPDFAAYEAKKSKQIPARRVRS